MAATAIIRANIEIVEYAKISLKLFLFRPSIAKIKNKNIPNKVMEYDISSVKTGANFKIKKGAIFTIVAEWSNALTGVGATIAPRSQLSKGLQAPLIKAAKAIKIKEIDTKFLLAIISFIKIESPFA